MSDMIPFEQFSDVLRSGRLANGAHGLTDLAPVSLAAETICGNVVVASTEASFADIADDRGVSKGDVILRDRRGRATGSANGPHHLFPTGYSYNGHHFLLMHSVDRDTHYVGECAESMFLQILNLPICGWRKLNTGLSWHIASLEENNLTAIKRHVNFLIVVFVKLFNAYCRDVSFVHGIEDHVDGMADVHFFLEIALARVSTASQRVFDLLDCLHWKMFRAGQFVEKLSNHFGIPFHSILIIDDNRIFVKVQFRAKIARNCTGLRGAQMTGREPVLVGS